MTSKSSIEILGDIGRRENKLISESKECIYSIHIFSQKDAKWHWLCGREAILGFGNKQLKKNKITFVILDPSLWNKNSYFKYSFHFIRVSTYVCNLQNCCKLTFKQQRRMGWSLDPCSLFTLWPGGLCQVSISCFSFLACQMYELD